MAALGNNRLTYYMECHSPAQESHTYLCKTTKDLDNEDVLYDSLLFFHSLTETTLPVTWKIQTCYRHTSWNLWRKEHEAVHVDDVLVNKAGYYTMLPQLWDDSAEKFTLRNLTAVCPTLGIHDIGDVVYLVSKEGIYDKEAWVVGVDLRKKTVEVIEPYCAARSSLHQTSFLSSAFSGYLNATPRSCAPEDACGQNYPLYGYLRPGNIIQNNLIWRPQQIVGGYSRSPIQHGNDVHQVNSFQFQPQLVVFPHSFPQTPQDNFIPSGSGYVCLVSAQSTHLMLNTNAHAQHQMPREPVYMAIPFNTMMSRMPMDRRFLSHVPFDGSMHVWMQAPASLNEPVLPTATASYTLANNN